MHETDAKVQSLILETQSLKKNGKENRNSPIFQQMLHPLYLFEAAGVWYAADIEKARVVTLTRVHWRVSTNESVIDRFTVVGVTVYGAWDTRVYRLEVQGEWKQVFPRVPDTVLLLVVDHDKVYVVTKRRGIFRTSLRDENYLCLINN